MARIERRYYLSVKYIIISLFLVGISACTRVYDLPYKVPEDAPQEYKLGWEHGCKSGFSAYGNDWYKTMYHFEQDVSLTNDRTYLRAWNDAFSYCRSFVSRYLAGYSGARPQEGDNNPIFSAKKINLRLPDYNQHNVDAIEKHGFGWPGMFDGVSSPGWGSQAWSSDVPCEPNWLGKMPDGCGWMGY